METSFVPRPCRVAKYIINARYDAWPPDRSRGGRHRRRRHPRLGGVRCQPRLSAANSGSAVNGDASTLQYVSTTLACAYAAALSSRPSEATSPSPFSTPPRSRRPRPRWSSSLLPPALFAVALALPPAP